MMPPFQAHQVSSVASMVLLIARVLACGRISPSLFNQERLYSVAVGQFDRKWRPDSSDEDDEQISTSRKDLRFAKFGASSEEESEDDELETRSAIRKKRSSAALRNCDMKERRVLGPMREKTMIDAHLT